MSLESKTGVWPMMITPLGGYEFEADGRYLTLHLRESNDILDDPEAPRQRMQE